MLIELYSLDHFNFGAGGEAAVVAEGDFVEFDLAAVALQADRGTDGQKIVAAGDGDVVVVDRHGGGVHGEVAGQVVGVDRDAADSAGGGVDVDQAVKPHADRVVALA